MEVGILKDLGYTVNPQTPLYAFVVVVSVFGFRRRGSKYQGPPETELAHELGELPFTSGDPAIFAEFILTGSQFEALYLCDPAVSMDFSHETFMLVLSHHYYSRQPVVLNNGDEGCHGFSSVRGAYRPGGLCAGSRWAAATGSGVAVADDSDAGLGFAPS